MKTARKIILLFLLIIQGVIPAVNGRAANDNTHLFLIKEFEKGHVGLASLNNHDESLMYSEIWRISTNKPASSVTWERKDGERKQYDNASYAQFSPRGDYYSFYCDKQLLVYASSGVLLWRIPINVEIYDYAWSYDSRYIFLSEEKLGDHILYRYDVITGEKKEILRSAIYFRPVTVLNSKVLYLLRNKTPDEPMYECDIVKLDLESGAITPVKLPEEYILYYSFTISPDETRAFFSPHPLFQIYVVDLVENKVIDTFQLEPGSGEPESFSWRLDGSYVIFTKRHIYKYVFGE